MIDIRIRSKPLSITLLSALALAACAEDFTPYNELVDFRVLGVRADRPTLAPGERTQLVPLLYQPEPAPVTYAWSWCPISTGLAGGYECAVTEEELQAALDRAVGEGVFDVPPFELSTTSSTTFTYDLPPAVLTGLCMAIKDVPLPNGITVPSCDRWFPIQVRLDASSAQKSITVVKELRLLYTEDGPQNSNPELGKVTIVEAGMPVGTGRELVAGTPLILARDVKYTLSVDVQSAASEEYEEPPESGEGPPVKKREVLAITWFSESGGMDNTRTTYIEGEISLLEAGTNDWDSPKAVDYPDALVRIFILIRDGRGGLGWLEREVGLEP